MERLVRVDASRVFYSFDPDIPPAAKASPGALVEFECLDALGGQIRSEEQTITSIDWSKVNPATGPLYVEGAEPGDALVVKILSIKLGEKGVVLTAPSVGALPHLTREARTRLCRIVDDKVEFRCFKLGLRKMIGVIGTASSERAPTGTPGRHGGNLDTRVIGEGATVYLPVEYKGGLLGVGDLHAVMGDGEVCVAACEVEGEVLVRVDVMEKMAPRWPVVETSDSCYILVSEESLDNAVSTAVEETVNVLSQALCLDWYDAYMLASMTVDFEISQIVDPRKTVRARIPKSVLSTRDLLKGFSRSN